MRTSQAARNLETLLAATIESSLLDVEGLGDDSGVGVPRHGRDRRTGAGRILKLVHGHRVSWSTSPRRRRCRRSVPSISVEAGIA